MYDYEHMRYKSRTTCLEDLDKLKDIAKSYGIVRVDDYNNIIGIKSEYMDTKCGWLEHMIENTMIGRDRCGYFINLPKPFIISDDRDETPVDDSEPSTLNIVLHTNEVSDPDAALAEIFKHIQTIKDRIVNISIM